MFTASLVIKNGLEKWTAGLASMFGRRPSPASPARPAGEVQVREEPRTEGERALWQAMGWEDSW